MANSNIKDLVTIKCNDQVVISVIETDGTGSDYPSSVSSRSSLEKRDIQQSPVSIEFSKSKKFSQELAEITVLLEPRVSTSQRARERLRLAYTFATSTYNDLVSSHQSISESHRFCRRIVNPLFTWKGENTRVITGKSLGATTIKDTNLGDKAVIHAASHNYVGFYRSTEQSEQLQQLALDSLQIAPLQSPPAIAATFHNELAKVFQAEFCYTTSTGYGSNLLAFPAILQPGWLCVMDAKSHNSMYVGAYISKADKFIKYRHNDMTHLEEILDENCGRFEHVLLAVEGLYSMDGTIPPLDVISRLKQRYGFVLLMDEAHSLLSVGETGKGCVELWNDTHPKAIVNNDLVDIRTATLSKSLGSIGGIVCGKEEFRACMEARWYELRNQGADPVMTATMVQCLHVLGQSTLLHRRLARMHQINHWARSELDRFGVCVYGDAVTPILPIHTGRPSVAAKLSYKLRKHGVLATPVSVPAVPFWQSRVRVCLSADHTDDQINTLVRTIVIAAQEVGIIGRRNLKHQTFTTNPFETHTNDESLEALESCQHIEELILQDASLHSTTISSRTIQAGHRARERFGLAAGGARWISGTFSVHLEVEKLVKEALELEASLTYADNYLGLLSTVSALCRPLFKHKVHKLFIPKDCLQVVLDGIKAAPRKLCPEMVYYASLEDLQLQVASTATQREQLTIYLPSSIFEVSGMPTVDERCPRSTTIYLDSFINKLKHANHLNTNLTILLHDTSSHLKHRGGQRWLTSVIQNLQQLTRNVLVYGGFMSGFEVPGAYLAGNEQLVEELKYCSRGYMFSTSCLPFTMGIVKDCLERCLEGDEVGV